MTRRLVVWVTALGIRKLHGPHLAEFRAAFDRRYARHDEAWRREVWAEAAEKAAARG